MKKPFFLFLALALALPLTSPGWGFFAHRTIAQVAVYVLPSGMQPFYFHHMGEIVKLSTDADERRSTDPKEASKHFMDIDHYGADPFGLIPKAWEKAEAKYTADTLRKYGTLPWTILDVKDQLAQAFRDGDTTAIVRLSADLCHYVSDAHVPLHTTENYDGQMTNQQGMHSLWESKLPERHIGEYKLDSEPAEYIKDPLDKTWKMLQFTYGFLGATFDLEEKTSRKFTPDTKYTFSHKYGKTRKSYSDEFADAYHKEVGGQVAYLMKLSATDVASMWMTAWKEAGSPNLTNMVPKKAQKVEKDSLGTQLKAWKGRELVSQELLLAMRKEKVVARPDQINSAVDVAAPVLETTSPTESTPTPAQPVPGAPGAAGAEKVKVKTKPADGPSTKKKAKPAKKADDGWSTPSNSGW